MSESDAGSGGGSGRREVNPRRGGQLIIGRLKDHGPANYQFRRGGDPSYYVRLMTSRGERILWGKDLERAITEGVTRPKSGDLIGARRQGREAVTITVKQRGAEGQVVSQKEHLAHRTQWVVETVAHFAERKRLARRLLDEQSSLTELAGSRPEVRSAFLRNVRAAEEFASRSITNAQDRVRFVELIKNALETSIERGEPVPAVGLRGTLPRKQPEQKKSESSKPPPRRDREEPTR